MVGVASGLVMALSEKSAKDFKDGMMSIEDAGKFGTFDQLMSMFKSMSGLGSSGFWKVLADIAETVARFMDAGGAEAWAKLRKQAFSEENIRLLGQASEGWRFLTNALVDSTIAQGNWKREVIDGTVEVLQEIVTMVPNTLKNLGPLIANTIIKGFKDGIKSFDIKDFIEDWLEDQL